MAEILGSAVASESVSKLFSVLSGNTRDHESVEDKAERLEFAVLKIHSVVTISQEWQIVHRPLLNWKARLKCVAKEGDHILRAYKRRSTERKRNEGTARQANSIHKRITRAAKRFMPFGRGENGDDDPSDATVRRFERLADTADEFFRYVQLGGRPKSLVMSSKVPAESLLAGKTLEVRNGSQDALLLLRPCDGEAGSRKEVVLFLSLDDAAIWGRNVKLSVLFQLFEHTDILGIVMSSLELLPPQFGAACQAIREFVSEVTMKETSFSNPSVISVWCGATAWKCYHYSTDKGCTDGKLQLPLPIIRVNALCFAFPHNSSSNTPADYNIPLRLVCHISPHLVPKKYSDHYEQIEPQTLQELLPNEGVQGALACNGNWWCPRSSTYLSVEPVFSMPPPTLQQMYMMENSGTPV